MLAFQRVDGRLNRGALGGNQTRIRSVELVREGNLLLTFFCDGERRDNGVDFLGFQRRD